MQAAIALARQAGQAGEVPVGAVITKDGQIVGTGQNRRESLQNALAHAEIEAISMACKTLGTWRLDDCTLYVTLEPCPMCAGAILNARISTVVYGANDPKRGACDSVGDLFRLSWYHRPELYAGICEAECRQLLSDFFTALR